MHDNEKTADRFIEAARKGEPVFALYSENPDNIPCQQIRMEHKFTDKALLCNLLGQFIEVLKDEIEIDLEMQGYIEAERNGKLY